MVITASANHTSRTFFKRLNFVFEMKRIFLFNRYFYHMITFFIFTVFIVRMFILFCSRFFYLSAQLYGIIVRDRARFLFSFFEDEEASGGLIRQARSTLPGAGSTDMEQLYLRKNYQNSCSFNRFIQLKINYWLL